MPDRFGAFKGISVPELPWLREKPEEPHDALDAQFDECRCRECSEARAKP